MTELNAAALEAAADPDVGKDFGQLMKALEEERERERPTV